jgi:outer membrane receptor for ferrienterochelin and colicins
MRTAMLIAMALLMAYPHLAWSQASSVTVTGRVTSSDGAVPYATVLVKGTSIGALADEDGGFRLQNLRPGEYTLLASAQGYTTEEQRVTVSSPAVVSFTLRPTPVSMDPIAVTGTMKQTTVSQSPVKVEVVPAAVLRRSATSNLMEAIGQVNGLYAQVDCGVCYTNNIRINGMEGPYTAVLIDGMPIMSSLASVYGLNGINPSIIERIEIVKGPNSTLYGSEAMAGVINVITKDPRFAPRLAVDAYGSSHGQVNLDFAVSPSIGAARGLFSGNVHYMDNFVDENGDGFADVIMDRRVSLFGKVAMARALTLTSKFYHEERAGGVEAFSAALRGSDEVYGESIYTTRFELLGSYRVAFRSNQLRMDVSYNYHDQDSFYGDTEYAGRQNNAFANLIWDARAGSRHDLLLGLTARYQTYNDNTPATLEPERRFIPGIFAQDEYTVAAGVSLLGGVRLDHHREHGLIFSPRAAIKWEPFRNTALRLNGGTGFRTVNLFTEDHAALTGARQVVIAEALQPERSYSATLNVNQILEFGPNPMMIDADLFYTRFTNKIIPDYDHDPNQIVYANLSGYAVSRGLSLSMNQNVHFDRFLYTVGVTFQDVFAVEEGERTDELFAPTYRAVWSGSYTMRRSGFVLDYTGTLTGPMRLPEYDPPYARPTESPVYSVHNLQARYPLRGGVEIYGAVNNLFDYTQPSPLIDPGNPFGDDFDASYLYGPLQGRRFILGARYGLSR